MTLDCLERRLPRWPMQFPETAPLPLAKPNITIKLLQMLLKATLALIEALQTVLMALRLCLALSLLVPPLITKASTLPLPHPMSVVLMLEALCR